MTKKFNNGYSYNEVEDFLQDEYFVNWVLHPNAETDHFWNNWISRHPEKRKHLALARELVQSLTYKNEERLAADDYSMMLERLLSEQQSVGDTKVFSMQRMLKIAAVFILVAISTFLIINRTDIFKSEEAPWLVVKTQYGQKRTLYLPDGTKVNLNAGSTISYPEKFSGQERKVKFSGEGFFDVTRNEKQPFVISSDKFTAKVLGTSFNLRSISEEDDHSVAVVTGKVQVTTTKGMKEVLEATDMAAYKTSIGELTKTTFDSNKVLAWKDDILWFENDALPRVFDKLEKWYGVKILVKQGVDLKGHYTGRYKNNSLDQILQGITFTSNLKYKINHKNVTIYE